MRVWVVSVLLLISAAGCADSGNVDTDEDVDAADPAQSATEGNETQEVAPMVPNTPPDATLNATADELVATFNITISDADGDNLTWELDAEGDGEADAEGNMSALVNHTFAAPGTYNASLTVSDGINTTAVTYELNITQAPPPLPGQHAEGEFYAGGMTLIGCFGDIFGVGFPEALDGVFYASFALEEHTIGYAYSASVTTTIQDSPGFAFLDADWGVITSGFMSTHATGEVPEGAAYGVWWTCLGGAPVHGSFDSVPV